MELKFEWSMQFRFIRSNIRNYHTLVSTIILRSVYLLVWCDSFLGIQTISLFILIFYLQEGATPFVFMVIKYELSCLIFNIYWKFIKCMFIWRYKVIRIFEILNAWKKEIYSYILIFYKMHRFFKAYWVITYLLLQLPNIRIYTLNLRYQLVVF